MDGNILDKIVKFNAQASGRDKLFRLVQYCSKFVWWYLHKAEVADDLVEKLKLLSSALSTCRKFLRVGKSIDFVQAALKTLHTTDNVLRWTITVSKLNQAVYLIFDHIVLAGRIGIANVDKEKWNKLSAQFWVATLILGIVRAVYDMTLVFSRDLRAREAKAWQYHKTSTNGDGPDTNNRHIRRNSSGAVPTRLQVVLQSLSENKPLALDLIKNVSDLVLPLEALGHLNASPGVQGLAGIISSVIGIVTTWQPLLRLVPS